MHSLTFRSLCVSFLLHLFICVICESLYKQLVHSLHFLTDDTDKQNKQIFFANRTQSPKGRGTHRIVGQVDRLLVLSVYVVFVLFYTSSGSVYSLTFRSLCVSFLLHLFICVICESL